MNYYVTQTDKINRLNKQKEKALEQCMDRDLLTTVVTSYFDDKINDIAKIHIGKSSAGWEFLFNLNDKQYYHDKESLIAYLKYETIEDEYGREITFDDFWNKVVLNRVNVKPNTTMALHATDYCMIDGLEFLDSVFS